MAGPHLRCGSDYETFFDPKIYLNLYDVEAGLHDFIKCEFEGLHEIYSEGKVKGNRLIDIGAGPSIHSLIPAARWFNEIYISDFSARNREAQTKWLAKDPDSFDWQHIFRYFADKDGQAEKWPQYEQELRDKVKDVLACDFHQRNPLHPENLGQFDAVTTSFALESGSKDLEQFKNAMRNVVSLIAEEGYLILFTGLNYPYYTVGPVGGEKFWCLYLTYEEVLESVKEAGVEVVKVYRYDYETDEDLSPSEGVVLILGRKERES